MGRQGRGREGPAARTYGISSPSGGPGRGGKLGRRRRESFRPARTRRCSHVGVGAGGRSRAASSTSARPRTLLCGAGRAVRSGSGIPPGGRRRARPHPPSLSPVRSASTRICSSIFSHHRTCTSHPHTWKLRTCRRAVAERRTKVPARIVPLAGRRAWRRPPASGSCWKDLFYRVQRAELQSLRSISFYINEIGKGVLISLILPTKIIAGLC